MKLTDQQKQEKRQRDNLQHICNKLLSTFSFGRIKTWRDTYTITGIDNETINANYPNANNPLTFPELKKYCDELKVKLEDSIKGRASVPVAAESITVVEPPTEVQLTKELDNDYGLVPSPNEKAYLYWFQKKACAEMLSGFGIT